MSWVFGYGSLLWRPGFEFAERRTALLRGYHRAFCRYSLRHRGTPERPGLVVGLKPGGRCTGAAFRLTPEQEPTALAYLDEREGPGYHRLSLPVALDALNGDTPTGGDAARAVPAWAYVPDQTHPSYFGEQEHARLVELVAGGRGESGTALDYLADLIAHLQPLGIREPELEAVLAEARGWAAGTR